MFSELSQVLGLIVVQFAEQLIVNLLLVSCNRN